MHGDTILATGKPENRIIRGLSSCEIFQKRYEWEM